MPLNKKNAKSFIEFIMTSKMDVDSLKPWERQALSGYLGRRRKLPLPSGGQKRP